MKRLISYTRRGQHNYGENASNQADFFFLTSIKSTLLGVISTDRAPRSSSRFSIIQRASIADAHCSTHESSSHFRTLDRFAERFSDINSKSCSEVRDASSRNSRGGRGMGSLRYSGFDLMVHNSTENNKSATVPLYYISTVAAA